MPAFLIRRRCRLGDQPATSRWLGEVEVGKASTDFWIWTTPGKRRKMGCTTQTFAGEQRATQRR